MTVRKRKKRTPATVDSALIPFLDALANLLAAQEARLDAGRRLLRRVAAGRTAPRPKRKRR